VRAELRALNIPLSDRERVGAFEEETATSSSSAVSSERAGAFYIVITARPSTMASTVEPVRTAIATATATVHSVEPVKPQQ
jgi:hypothetical protein